MSNYSIQKDWSGVDALPDSDPEKVVSGNHFNTEFTAVQTAVNSKAELAGSAAQAFTATTATSGTNTTQVATTEFVTTAIAAATPTAAEVNGHAYPVGSIYTSISPTNPATLLGVGTWVAFASGRTLVGLDSGQTEFDIVEETGGSKTHTLTEAEMPSHTHTYEKANIITRDVDLPQYVIPIVNGYTTGTSDPTGGGQAHNNLQPYITVYFWKRTA